MNKDILQGQWTQLKGRIRKQWGKLTDDDVGQVQGDAEVLSGKTSGIVSRRPARGCAVHVEGATQGGRDAGRALDPICYWRRPSPT